MADQYSVAIKLLDALSGPADEAQAALEALSKASGETERASRDAAQAVDRLGREVASAGAEASRGAAGMEAAARAAEHLDRAAGRARHSVGALHGPLTREQHWTQWAAGQARGEVHGPMTREDHWAQLAAETSGAMHGPQQHHGKRWYSQKEWADWAEEHGRGKEHFGPVLRRDLQKFSIGDRLKMGTEDLMRWNTAAGETIAKWRTASLTFMQTPFGFVTRGVGMMALGVAEVGKALFDVGLQIWEVLGGIAKIGVAAGAVAGAYVVYHGVRAAGRREGDKGAFEKLAGSPEEGAKWFDASRRAAGDLAMKTGEATDYFKGLRAAQFDLKQADTLVRMSADLVAVTGHADAAERAIRAITQIKGKGKLQAEELTGQLAEAGVSSELVYDQLKKVYGLKSSEQVISKITAGEVKADVAIPAIIAAVGAKLHTDNFGQISKERSYTTLDGLIQRFETAPDRMFDKVAAAIDTGPVKKSLARLVKAFEDVEGSGIARFIDVIVSAVPSATDYVLGFFQGFGDGFDQLLSRFTGSGSTDFEWWGQRSGAAVVAFFGRVVEAGKWLAEKLPPALAAFWDGLGLDKIGSSFEELNFKQVGEDLAAVGKALGLIAHYTAEIVPGIIKAIGYVSDAAPLLELGGRVATKGSLAIGDYLTDPDKVMALFESARALSARMKRDDADPEASPAPGDAPGVAGGEAVGHQLAKFYGQPTFTPAPAPEVRTQVDVFDNRVETKTTVSHGPRQFTPAAGPAPYGGGY